MEISSKILWQLAVYALLCIVGGCVSAALPFTFSASIISMMILFAFLVSGVLKESQIKETSDFLIQNLSLFLVPASVSIIEHYKLLLSLLVPLLVICTVSMVLTFAATAFTVSVTAKLFCKREKV